MLQQRDGLFPIDGVSFRKEFFPPVGMDGRVLFLVCLHNKNECFIEEKIVSWTSAARANSSPFQDSGKRSERVYKALI